MKERPIIFNTSMVRAILDGRKTQTRRIIKAPKGYRIERAGVDFPCPYGFIEDRLWVRETYTLATCRLSKRWDKGTVLYRADHGITHGGVELYLAKWIPSIHMPRCTSRITLEITNVRVERLQDISEKDAEAEGGPSILGGMGYGLKNYRQWFSGLWESIHGPDAWDNNPWVWAVEFKRIS